MVHLLYYPWYCVYPQIWQTEYPHFDGGFVEHGFYGAWTALADGGLTARIQSLFTARPGTDMLVTGHSLGGALAQIAALEMKANPIYSTALSIGDVNVITFGSPRAFNYELATYFNSATTSNWRVTNEGDPAPSVPLQSMGYYHTAIEIHYTDAAARTYDQCDGSGEDWNCYFARNCVANVFDHITYFDEFLSCGGFFGDSAFESVSTTNEPTGDEQGKSEQGLGTVPVIALVVLLVVGWLVAVVFFCFWRRARKLNEVEITYQAFGDQNAL